ncbi:beta-1,3-galactosyltransferase 5-like [Asterias amurensis]|uniref:beta-1,3-galactosyltransferase 5-like n=1 Tax=Asterias amurensis TaxID=7602 RepID=UPI003AB3743E
MVTADFISNRHFATCGIIESVEPVKGSGSERSKVLIASSATYPTNDMDNNGKNKRRRNGVPTFINAVTGRLTGTSWAIIVTAIVLILYIITRENKGGGSMNDDGMGGRAQNPKFHHVLDQMVESTSNGADGDDGVVLDLKNKLKGFDNIDSSDLKIDFPDKPPAIKKGLPAPKPKEFPVDLIYKPDLQCPDEPHILFLVTTTPEEVLARTAIRRSWGNRKGVSTASILGMTWRTVFVMGRSKIKDEQIKREAQHFGDVLQGEFEDIKTEETRKTMMGFQWASNDVIRTCQPKYIFKTNAKVYIHVPLVINWIQDKLGSAPNLYVGKLLREDHPIRDKLDPYFVPRPDYPGNVFPNMARGPLYMISMDVVQRMVSKFGQITPIAMEDAYVGLLAASVGVQLTDDDHFVLIKKPSNFCHYRNMMIVFDIEPTEIMSVYDVVEQGHRKSECGDRGF